MDNNNISKEVLIVVSGGVVQCIFSSDKNIKVDLLDYDNEIFDNDKEADEEFENRKEDLYNIKF